MNRFFVRGLFILLGVGVMSLSTVPKADALVLEPCTGASGGQGFCSPTDGCIAGTDGGQQNCGTGRICCVELPAAGSSGSGPATTGVAEGGACSDRLDARDVVASDGSCRTIASCSGTGTMIGGTAQCRPGLICCIGLAPGAAAPTTGTTGGATTGTTTSGPGFGGGTTIGGPKCDPLNFREVAGVCIPVGTGLPENPLPGACVLIFVPICIGFTGSIHPIVNLLTVVMFWLLNIVGYLAIIAFIIAGLQYVLAFGDERQIETAKENTKYALIGIVVALSGFIIITAIDRFLRGFTIF